jgi:hypothetical protein
MRSILIALPFVLAATACGKTECEKYADMEWKCGNYPASEETITRQAAQGMCMGAKDMEDDTSGVVEHFRKEAACAAKHSDCAAYKACTDAVK